MTLQLTIGDGIAVASVAYLLRYVLVAWSRKRSIDVIVKAVAGAALAFQAADKK